MASPASTFILFGELPIELRLKILQLSISPRLVRFPYITVLESTIYEKPDALEKASDRFQFPSAGMPSILRINKESYEAFNHFYQPGLVVRRSGQETRPKISDRFANTPFNPSIDTMYIDKWCIQRLLKCQHDCFKHVRFVTTTNKHYNTFPNKFGFAKLLVMDVVADLERIREACPNVEHIYFCLLDNYTTPSTREHNRTLIACIHNYWAKFYGRPNPWSSDPKSQEGKKLLRFTDPVVQAREEEIWRRTVKVVLFDEMREERGISDEQVLPHGPHNF